MATSQMSTVLQRLRSTLLAREAADLTDGQILNCFVQHGESAALEALVRRHGPMVWGVCRRMLGHHHDAEDAFQATFLVLVRKAAGIKPKEMVGNWLYGVARQTALKARATRAKRRKREAPQTIMPEPTAVEPDCWKELQPLLDQELGRLPNRYRAVIVLCDLEGKSRQEAARALACPEGTVASRLARARALLAKRLAGSGLGLSAVALGTALSHNAQACVPASLLASTIKVVTLTAAGQMGIGLISGSVAALTERVITAMFLHKLKTLTIVFLMVSMLGLGGAYALQRAGAQADTSDQASRTDQTREQLDKDKQATRSDLESIQGTWVVMNRQINGVQITSPRRPDGRRTPVEQATFTGAKLTTNFMGGFTFRLDPAARPKAIDLHPLEELFGLSTPEESPAKVMRGIYRLQGDDLTICFVQSGKRERPSAFENYWQAASHTALLVLQRDANSSPQAERSPRSGGEKASPAAAQNASPAAGEGAKAPAPQKTDVIGVGDRLRIQSVPDEPLPAWPFGGICQVEASGRVPLGPMWGRVKIAGQPLEEAEKTIEQYLRPKVKPVPSVQITRYEAFQGTEAIDALKRRVDDLEKEVKALRATLHK